MVESELGIEGWEGCMFSMRFRWIALASMLFGLGCGSTGSGGGGGSPDGGGASGSGGTSSGATGGVGGVGGGSGGLGGLVTGGAGGIGGASGAGGTGGQSQLNACSNYETTCSAPSDCCVGDPAGGGCLYTGFGSQCYPKCTKNEQCQSGCCSPTGICSGAYTEGGVTKTICDPSTCAGPGMSCNTKDCCAGAVCLNLLQDGNGWCAVQCLSDSDCPGGCCKPIASGAKVCLPWSLCS